MAIIATIIITDDQGFPCACNKTLNINIIIYYIKV